MRLDDSLLIWSTRVFRVLLILYPGAFRRDYGREMTLVFRDTCRRTWHRPYWRRRTPHGDRRHR